MRVNGLSKPFNGLQVLTWFLFPFFIIGYTLLAFLPQIYLPAASTSSGYDVQTYLLSTLTYLCSLLAIYFGGVACTTDPIDEHLAIHCRTNPNGRSKGGDGKTFCWVCQVHVKKTSKHCRFCDKCVDEFDHHCQWLNTCVGGKNYKPFFRCVCMVFLFTLIELVSISVLIARFYTTSMKDGIRLRVVNLYGGNENASVFIIVAMVFAVILIVTVAMIAQLFFFHVNLQRRGISTYEYVVEDNKKRQKRGREKMEREKRKREEERRMREAGAVKVCNRCWVGGRKLQGATGGGDSDDVEQQNTPGNGEESENVGAANVDENSIELTEMIVRDDDFREAEL